MRSVSAELLAAMNAQETGEVLLFLLTINHADLIEPLRFVNNNTAIVSNGATYSPYWFDLQLPDDSSGGISSVRLTIDNIDRQIALVIRSITTAATLDLSLILASAPDDLELTLSGLTLRNVEFNAATVSGELIFEERLSNQYPKDLFTPQNFPGLF